MTLIAYVKNEERAFNFAKEILSNLKKDIKTFEVEITKIRFNTFKINLKERR